MPKRTKNSQKQQDSWSPEFLQVLGSCSETIERPASQPISRMRDPFGSELDLPSMSDDAAALLNEVLRLPENERLELASRLFAQESSVISAEPAVMSGAPVFRGTRVLAQTLIEYLKAGDSIDDFLEGFPSVSREQVIVFLEETKARVLAYAG
jgi:uncharacterized protein (DUF433 family)